MSLEKDQYRVTYHRRVGSVVVAVGCWCDGTQLLQQEKLHKSRKKSPHCDWGLVVSRTHNNSNVFRDCCLFVFYVVVLQLNPINLVTSAVWGHLLLKRLNLARDTNRVVYVRELRRLRSAFRFYINGVPACSRWIVLFIEYIRFCFCFPFLIVCNARNYFQIFLPTYLPTHSRYNELLRA